jgi:small-conductance mechanosensitive channel
MAMIKNPIRVVGGAFVILLGASSIWLGNYLSENDVTTFYDKTLLSAMLWFLGYVLAGIGVIMTILGIFTVPDTTEESDD